MIFSNALCTFIIYLVLTTSSQCKDWKVSHSDWTIFYSNLFKICTEIRTLLCQLNYFQGIMKKKSNWSARTATQLIFEEEKIYMRLLYG